MKNAALIAVLSVVGLVFLVGIIFGLMVMGAYNSGNDAESNIPAIYERNENTLAQFGQRIQEMAQVPGMQRDDLVAIFTNTLDARYGDEGADAAFLWLQEQNPQLNQQTYIEIGQAIESGRTEFQRNQDMLVDAKRSYCRRLGSFPNGPLMRMVGFPHIEIGCERVGQSAEDDAFPIISTRRAQDAFETGVEEGPIPLR